MVARKKYGFLEYFYTIPKDIINCGVGEASDSTWLYTCTCRIHSRKWGYSSHYCQSLGLAEQYFFSFKMCDFVTVTAHRPRSSADLHPKSHVFYMYCTSHTHITVLCSPILVCSCWREIETLPSWFSSWFPPTLIRDIRDINAQNLSGSCVISKCSPSCVLLEWWLIDVAIANAHRLYQIQIDPKCSVLEFRTKPMHELAGDSANTYTQQQPKRPWVSSATSPSHSLVLSDRQRDCLICSHRPSGRVTTQYCCSPCNVYVCVTSCYDHLREANE